MRTALRGRLNKHFSAASALVAAAALGGAVGSADAAVVYSGVVNINIPSTTAGVYLNVQTGVNAVTPAGAPGWDLNLYSSTGLIGWQSTPTTLATVWVSAGVNLSNLPVGTLIDGTSAFTATSPSASTTAPAGFVSVLNGNNIYGFRFINEANGNQTHYGWVRVSVSGTFQAQPRAIVDYAYEDQAGVGIAAGSTSSASTGACCFGDGTCTPNVTPAACQTGGGVFNGAATCAAANCPQPGRCCKPDGTCAFILPAACTSASGVFTVGATCAGAVCTGACCKNDGTCDASGGTAACAAAGGVYSGNGVTCAQANCPQPGACCKFDGTCSIQPPTLCANGLWQGSGTTCAAACPATPPVFYQNCNLPTGTTTLSGVAAPAGSQWSECARDEVDPNTANTNAGYSALAAFREADDFTIPAGGKYVAYIKFAAYQTAAAAVTINTANLQIWNGAPGVGSVIFGDTTTNRLANAEFAPIYRVFPSLAPITGCTPGGTAPDQNRHIQWVYVAVNKVLPAGTYWWDVQMSGSTSFTGPWLAVSTDPDATGRICTGNNANSMVLNGGWVANADVGQGCAPTTVGSDLYFELLGTNPPVVCYANCDNSTQPPILNVGDFTCFLQKFAAGDPYANCDSSTQPPVLNVGDFTCFLQKFAAGCT